MPKAKITQTGPDSAVVEPIVLRPGDLTRLVFKPQIVNNKQDENKLVKGHVLWQKRGKSEVGEEWADDRHGLFCLAYSPDGKTVATGGTEPAVKLWDAATGELRGKLEGHTDQVHALAYSTDGRRLASAGRDTLVLVWPTGAGRR